MAIKCYVGRMGSGKTYEVVSSVILPALARGRRVVSNIAGLDYQAFVDLLVAEGTPFENIGQLVQISHDDVLKPFFWRTDKPFEDFVSQFQASQKFSRFKSKVLNRDDVEDVDIPSDYFVQPGDLLALDEIWRFWDGFGARDGEGQARPKAVMNFFRMHRHFTHSETGVACDVALITQDILDLSRSVRAVVEETFSMTKLTSLGMTTRYRVDVYAAAKMRNVLRSYQRSYEDKYFPLYKSHSQAKEGDASAVEENIDGRGNILKGPLFKIVLPIGFFVLCLSIWSLWRFFHPKPKTEISSAVSQAKSEEKKNNISESEEWRIVGWSQYKTNTYFLLASTSGRNRFVVAPPNFKITSFTAELLLPNGDAVTNWSGGSKGDLIGKGGDKK